MRRRFLPLRVGSRELCYYACVLARTNVIVNEHSKNLMDAISRRLRFYNRKIDSGSCKKSLFDAESILF